MEVHEIELISTLLEKERFLENQRALQVFGCEN